MKRRDFIKSGSTVAFGTTVLPNTLIFQPIKFKKYGKGI